MNGESARALRDNVARLMAASGDSQAAVAARGLISQRSVGNVLTYGKTHETEPTLRTVDGLAKAFDLPTWLLFVPDCPIDLLSSNTLAKLINLFAAAPEDGRDMIFRVAESEVRYAVSDSKAKVG